MTDGENEFPKETSKFIQAAKRASKRPNTKKASIEVTDEIPLMTDEENELRDTYYDEIETTAIPIEKSLLEKCKDIKAKLTPFEAVSVFLSGSSDCCGSGVLY